MEIYVFHLKPDLIILPHSLMIQHYFLMFQNNSSKCIKFQKCRSGYCSGTCIWLSMGNEYMTSLTERGINADDAASKIRFSFGIGSNYFFEIAKLRAARLLWSVVTGGLQTGKNESVQNGNPLCDKQSGIKQFMILM